MPPGYDVPGPVEQQDTGRRKSAGQPENRRGQDSLHGAGFADHADQVGHIAQQLRTLCPQVGTRQDHAHRRGHRERKRDNQ